MVELTKKMRLVDEGDEGDEGDTVENKNFFVGHSDLPMISGWELDAGGDGQANQSDLNSGNESVDACAMGVGGRIVVGVGSRGTIWIWANKERTPQ